MEDTSGNLGCSDSGARSLRLGDLPDSVERVCHSIIGCAIEVHRELGPGLLEKIYEQALVYELTMAGLHVQQQVIVDVPYKATVLRGQVIDLFVGDCVIVELKAVSKLLDVHTAQVLSYLHATDQPLGLLMNFHAPLLKNELRRVLNSRWSALQRKPPMPKPLEQQPIREAAPTDGWNSPPIPSLPFSSPSSLPSIPSL